MQNSRLRYMMLSKLETEGRSAVEAEFSRLTGWNVFTQRTFQKSVAADVSRLVVNAATDFTAVDEEDVAPRYRFSNVRLTL